VESADTESVLSGFQLMFRAKVYSLWRIPLCQIHIPDYLCTLCIITYILDFILQHVLWLKHVIYSKP